MPTPDQPTAFADLEGSLRATLEKNSPEVLADDRPDEAPLDNGTETTAPAEKELPTIQIDNPPAGEGKLPEEEQAPTLEESLEEAQREKDETAAEEKKQAEDAKKVAEETAKNVAHPDLEADFKKLDPHTKPKTRQLIEMFKGKAIAERERATKAEQAIVAAQKERDDYKAQIAAGRLPKETEEELTTLRTRVRELDARQDPEIQSKYDKPISSNTDAAIALLGEVGLFKVKDKVDGKDVVRDMTDKERAQTTEAVKKNGVSIRSMAQHIKALENAGEIEAAEQLRDLARHNDQLGRDKAAEIAKIQTDVTGRAQARTKEQQAAQEQLDQIQTTTSQKALGANLQELAKTFPQINRPADPLPTDPAPVVASKKAAQTAYDAAAKAIESSVKVFAPADNTPQKVAESRGNMMAAAVESVILKNHVVPAMVKERDTALARVKELEAQVAGYKKAGTINRGHAASITQGSKPTNNLPAGATLADSIMAAAKAAGVNVDE